MPLSFLLRCILLAMLCASMGGTFLIEQPGSSVMRYYFRLEWLAASIPAHWMQYTYVHACVYVLHGILHILCVYVHDIQVYRSGWWMAHFGARSPKRHQAFSNNKWIETFNKGKLLRHQRKPDPTFAPTKSYLNANGKRCWQGTPQLKETQSGP